MFFLGVFTGAMNGNRTKVDLYFYYILKSVSKSIAYSSLIDSLENFQLDYVINMYKMK